MPKTSSVRIFSECQNSGQQWISFWTFVSSQAKCNSQNCLNFLKHPSKLSPKSFGALRFFKFLNFWGETILFSVHTIFWKLSSSIQNSQTAKMFLSLLENISQEFSRMPNFFGQHGKQIHKFPQPFNSLEHPSKWTVQWRVDLSFIKLFFLSPLPEGHRG